MGKKYLTAKQIKQILNLLKKKNTPLNRRKKIGEWYTFCLFTFETGSRIKEYTNLKWKDFDFSKYPVTANIPDISYTKTPAGIRDLYIYNQNKTNSPRHNQSHNNLNFCSHMQLNQPQSQSYTPWVM